MNKGRKDEKKVISYLDTLLDINVNCISKWMKDTTAESLSSCYMQTLVYSSENTAIFPNLEA